MEWETLCHWFLFLILIFIIIIIFYFTILYWSSHTSTRICHRVYTCSPSWSPLPPPSPYHPSGSSQCTSPKLPVSCIEPGLAICFLYDIIHVLMSFSQIIPPPTESKRLFYKSVSLLLSHIQGCRYHLSKFHIYALVYCIGSFYFFMRRFDLSFPKKLLLSLRISYLMTWYL